MVIIMTEKQQQTIDRALCEAAQINNPSWHHYAILKQQLEREGIYSADVIRRLADVLNL